MAHFVPACVRAACVVCGHMSVLYYITSNNGSCVMTHMLLCHDAFVRVWEHDLLI